MAKKKSWIHVNTVSTFPPEGTFAKSGEEIADIMARPEVSPKGLGSAIKMVVFFKNRAGKHLNPERKAEKDKAIKILQDMKAKDGS